MTNFLFHSIHFLHTPQSYDKYYVYKLCISQKIYSSNSSLRKKVMHITRHHEKIIHINCRELKVIYITLSA
jgi:hypothetical protein